LLNISKKIQQGYRDFAKKFDNVIELPEKRPPTLSNFSKIIWQHYRSFKKSSLKFPAFPEKKKAQNIPSHS